MYDAADARLAQGSAARPPHWRSCRRARASRIKPDCRPRRLLLTDEAADGSALHPSSSPPTSRPTSSTAPPILGIVGKDILLEQQPDVYEPVDLGFGFCRWSSPSPASCGSATTPPSGPGCGWRPSIRADRALLLGARHPGRDGAPRRLHRAGAAGRPGRAHRRSRAVGRDAARQRPGRGRGDRDLDGAAHRQPGVAQDRARAGERPDRCDAGGRRGRPGGRRRPPR